MKTVLRIENNTSKKVWKVEASGTICTMTSGVKKNSGAVRSKQFETAADCRKYAEQLIRHRLGRGYKPVSSSFYMIRKSCFTEADFWNVLKKAKTKGETQEQQLEWLVAHLAEQPLEDLITFDEILARIFIKSYQSQLWAASYIITGDSSDDRFDFFRAWLLFQGEAVYESAIQNPESIIPVLQALEEKEEVPQFEDLTYIGALAFEEKTGQNENLYYTLYDEVVLNSYIEPYIELDWSEADTENLSIRFPSLWERYGENPLEC
ncbi:DUF4240 domain-containing protein [Metabacillus mangrovi]|uniref:DUF4240 domain-containing protein n=1 Tax=Metabacillus mangrovi TaxID=1491830 RepID=UPI001390A89A